MKKIIINCLILLLLLPLIRCSDAPLNNDIIRGQNLSKSCDLDPNALGQILKEDVNTQLLCLEESINEFIQYVERENRDFVTRDELGDFIKKFFQANSAKILGALKLFFKINMLLLNDQADRFSNSNISKMTELLISSNKEAVIIGMILKDINNDNYEESRVLLSDSLHRFAETTLKIISHEQGSNTLDITDFIKDLNNLDDINLDIDTIKSFLFIKQLLVGGKRDKITSGELKKFIRNLPKIALLGFDLFFNSPKIFKTDYDFLRFYATQLNILEDLLYKNEQDAVLFNMDDFINMLGTLPDNQYNIENFRESLVAFKKHFILGSPTDFTFGDLKRIIFDIRDLLKMVYFNYITAEHPKIKEIMDRDEPIINLPANLNIPEYDIFSPNEVLRLHDNFENIVQMTRLYRKADGHQYYQPKIVRTVFGINEAALLRWVTDRLVRGYGTKTDDEYKLNTKEFDNFLNDFKPLLVELNLWTDQDDTEQFSENTKNLIDLFQPNSNGDNLLDSVEIAEYTSLVFTAVKIGTNIKNELLKVCENKSGIESNPLFEMDCFRAHYFDIIFNKLKQSSDLKTLFKFYMTNTQENLIDYMKKVELFARDFPGDDNPIATKDVIKVFGAMLCIDSAIIRFDVNKNNILDPFEVDNTFTIYSNIVKMMAFAENPEDFDDYGETAFKYFLKYMKPPASAFQLYVYHITSRKKVTAKRINIGSLLCWFVREDLCFEEEKEDDGDEDLQNLDNSKSSFSWNWFTGLIRETDQIVESGQLQKNN